jgi:UDP-N-acetylglucosamine transferase subunit ALG13
MANSTKNAAKTQKICFVTVGTTNFDELIESIDNEQFIQLLKQFNFTRLIIQRGNTSKYSTKLLINNAVENNIVIEVFSLVNDIKQYLLDSSLIISHCGAGSVLESLACQKSLIVVTNSKLMNNHQIELAEALAGQYHCYAATPQTLNKVLTTANFSSPLDSTPQILAANAANPNSYQLITYPPANAGLFNQLLDEEMGFSRIKKQS